MNEQTEAAKKQAAENRAAREKAQEHYNSTIGKSRPTPTQEENDMAKLGAHLESHEDDGSGPDPNDPAHPNHPLHGKQETAKPSAGGYATRAATPVRPHRTE